MGANSTVSPEITVKRTDWHAIDWQAAHARVKNLRQRIYKARANGNRKKVRDLQKLMLRSHANLLVSVRRASQLNRGKNTPGIDRHVALTPASRSLLIDQLTTLKCWEPLSALRVYIPKANGKKRPLGIPTLIDRCQQAMVKNALEPCWEAAFEETSYGFRPGRSVHDAIERIYLATKSGSTRVWVLDADIKGCFDAIDHEYLLKTIAGFPAQGIIRKWLKAGYVENSVFHDTPKGTPQGGIISPLLANIALHGMEKAVGVTYRTGASANVVKQHSPVLVRYADDFVVLCHTKEAACEAKSRLQTFLAERGLEFSSEKTHVHTVFEGFDFLGFNIRSYRVNDRKSGYKTLIKPSKEKIKAFRHKVRDLFQAHSGKDAASLIRALNPVIRGWCNFYRYCVATVSFQTVEAYLHGRQKRWCRRNHARKSKKWYMRRYFRRHDLCPEYGYTFCDPLSPVYMLHASSFKVERWIKVRHGHVPDNPDQNAYWLRRAQHKSHDLKSGHQTLADRQRHICPVCRQSIHNGETLNRCHRDGNARNNSYANLQLLHAICHTSIQARSA